MRKEFIQFSRDKALLILILYAFVEIVICGYALTMEVRNLPVAVHDGDRSAESRALIEAFSRMEGFDLLNHVEGIPAIETMMDHEEIRMALIIPAGYSRDLKTRGPAKVQLLVDGSNTNIAGQAMKDAYNLLRRYDAEIIMANVQRSGQAGHGFLPQVENRIRVWYMPELKYVHFIMLTMLTISVVMLGILIPAASIVREKEAGTLEQLMVTPTKSLELIAAKMIPLIALKTVGLTIGIGMSLWLFDVPLRGSLPLFYAFSILMFLSSMGIGVLIGTFTHNMQQALLIGFFLLFPLAFLSGTTVPISNMPNWLQWLTYLSPLRYYVDVTLGIFLKGVGLKILWPEALALAIYGLVLFGVSTLRFEKSLA
jgi:ABC-2 type transport system permease protein